MGPLESLQQGRQESLKARWFETRVWRTSMGAYEVHELSAGVGVGVDGQCSYCGRAMSRLQIPARISDILSDFPQQFGKLRSAK